MMPPPAKRVWIIGGAGFLGSVLAELCRAEGWQPLVIDPAAVCPPAVAGHGGDAAALQQALQQGYPQVVYLCASTRGGDAAAYRAAYWEPVQQVLAVAPHARPVFCSSASVYSGQGLATEDSPTLPPGQHAKAALLLQAEAAVLATGGVVARLVALYGPGRCELLRRHLAGEPRLAGAPGRVLNYVHVHDAAAALLAMGRAECPAGRVYNVCAESFTMEQVYAALAELTHLPPAHEVAPMGRRGYSDRRVCSARLREELAWAPQVVFRDFVRAAL